MERLKKLYSAILKCKQHFWSHVLMLTGWILFFIFIILGYDENPEVKSIHPECVKPLAIYIAITLSSFLLYFIFFVVLFIEKIFLKKIKITWLFIIENHLYDFIWILGICFAIITLLNLVAIIILFIVGCCKSLIYKILY